MSLRKYHDRTPVANHAAAYTPCLRIHENLTLTAILIKVSEINLKQMYIQKIENQHFDKNHP